MRYELSTPMMFSSAGLPGQEMVGRREAHFDDGDCRTCGGECRQPALAVQPPPLTSRRRYTKIRRARIKDAF